MMLIYSPELTYVSVFVVIYFAKNQCVISKQLWVCLWHGKSKYKYLKSINYASVLFWTKGKESVSSPIFTSRNELQCRVKMHLIQDGRRVLGSMAVQNESLCLLISERESVATPPSWVRSALQTQWIERLKLPRQILAGIG